MRVSLVASQQVAQLFEIVSHACTLPHLTGVLAETGVCGDVLILTG
jgi:hypothetical protein